MTGVEFLATQRLRSWAFEFLRDKVFGKGADSARIDALVTPTVGIQVSLTLRLHDSRHNKLLTVRFGHLLMMRMQAPPLPKSAEATGESNTKLVVSLMKHIFIANLLGLPVSACLVCHSVVTCKCVSMLIGAHVRWPGCECADMCCGATSIRGIPIADRVSVYRWMVERGHATPTFWCAGGGANGRTKRTGLYG